MKRWLFLMVCLLALAGQANAQRYLPGMRGLELRGGFVDGVQKPLNYYAGVGLSTYTKRATAGCSVRNILRSSTNTKISKYPKHKSPQKVAITSNSCPTTPKRFSCRLVVLHWQATKQAIGATSYCPMVRPSATKILLSMAEQSHWNLKPTYPTKLYYCSTHENGYYGAVA